MKTYPVVCALVLCLLVAAALPVRADDPAQPWTQLYTGDEATGPTVIGLWQFLPGQETKDGSGNGHDLALRGEARFATEGPFGAALESFPADKDNDTAQGAIARDTDALSPSGAFTVEAWFAAKPEMDQYPTVFLIDKKYFHYARETLEANTDYCIYLTRTGENRRRVMVSLGFGDSSEFISGPQIDLPPGEWTHLAYSYDAAGWSRFFINGELAAKLNTPNRGPVTPGRYDLTIGDRHGSTYAGFPGYIAQVRLSAGIVPYFTGGLLAGTGVGRTVFIRMEQDVTVPLVISNDTNTTLRDGTAQITFGGGTRQITLPELGPNQEQTIPIAVDTSVRPDEYIISVEATARADDRVLRVDREIPIAIVPRKLPDQMPVVMWGGGDIDQLKEIGFTHQLIHLVSEPLVWEARQPVPAMSPAAIEERGRMLDNLLKNGLSGAVYPYPGTWVTRDETRKQQYNRVNRGGEVREKANVCGNFPIVQELCYNVGASIAQTFGHYPALNASLIHSEVRDGTDLCFHDHDFAAFRQAAGYDIPAEAVAKNGVHYSRIASFPANRVIPDDDRILGFYRWFWKDGDGWNPLHTQIARGLKSTGRNDLWTFFDPAVRVPAIWGSGGEVDIVSQWTYSYPDPIKIGQSTDELFAMAEGRPGQDVMKMTQVIWYRTGTAPNLPEDEADRADWEKEQPEAPFITIAPDHIREAFWSKLSRPIRGIMYHGWGSLVDTGSTTGYVFTNPETRKVLTDLTHGVIRPLGPTLLQVPDRPSDVAILESFSSQMFAGRGSYGWSNSWEADMHLILQWAHLQPKVLFDETVVRDGLDAYSVLVMPYCDVLTEGVVAAIKAFQRRGGIVVADEFLCPAILPDIVIPVRRRTGKADEDKAALQAKAASLREQLDPFYTRRGDAPDPDIVLRFRQYGDCDYLFVLNDKREFGDYVGHHGRVMEKGLPNSSTVAVRRQAGFVYDLVRHRPVATKETAEGLEFGVSFGPGDGTVFLISPQRVAAIGLEAPERAALGATVDVTVTVTDGRDEPVQAVIPLHIQVLDPRGAEAEFSGYWAAKDGRVSLRLNPAINDPTGSWTLRATELASGKVVEQRLEVTE